MRLKTILAGTATLLTLMAANTVKAQAVSQSTTATSDADTTATSSATTTKQVVTLHNSSADSSSGSNDTSNGTATNSSSSTSSSSTSSSSTSSSSTSSSSTSSSSASSSTSSFNDSSADASSSSTPSTSASSSSTPAPVSPVKADSTVKDATPDTTVSDESSTANPAASELNQQQLLVQSQAKSTSATLANSQLNTQMYNAAVTSQKGSLLASNLATGTLPFASFKMLLAKAALPVNGIGADDIVSITDTNGETYAASDVLSAYASYTAVYQWSIADGVTITDGDTATITLPDNLRFTASNFAILTLDKKHQVGTITAVNGAKTATMTFNSYFAENQSIERKGTLTFSTNGLDKTAGDANYKINKVGWLVKQGSEQLLLWNIVINPNGETWNNVQITDELGLYQTLDTNSVNVETVDTTGHHTPTSDYTLTVDGNILTFSFSQIKTQIYLYYNVAMVPDHAYTNSAMVAYTPANGTDPDGSGTTIPGDGGNPSTGTNDNQETAQSNPVISFGGSATAEGVPVVYSALITKTDADDSTKVLAGAMYDLYDSAGTQRLKKGLLTDTNGQIMIGQLAAGDYVLKETQAPTGYLLSSKLINLTIGDKTAKITVPGSKFATIVPVDITDTAIAKTALNVKKVWLQVPTNVATPDVTVTLYIKNADDTLTSTGQTLTLSSANKYQGTFSNLDATDAHGTPVVYKVVETVPTGYTSAQTTDGNQVTITNTYQTGTINIVKTGSDTKTGLAGATFALVDGNGQIVKTGTTDNQGQLVFTDLNQGSYTLKETNAPTGYQLVADQAITVDYTNGYTVNLAITDPVIKTTTITVNKHWANTQGKSITLPVTMTLSANGKAVQTLILTAEAGYTGQFTNLAMTTADGTPIVYTVSETPVAGYTMSGGQLVDGVVNFTNTLQTGSLTLTKVDSQTQAALTGATFDLRDANGQLVQTGTTDAQGRLTFTGLVSGTYTLHEAAAPTGYQLAADKMVTVDATSSKVAGIMVADVAVPVIVVPPTTTITVNKHWEQVPVSTTTPSVTVTLVANGMLTDQTLTLTAANGYTGQFTNLAVNDANDQAITYTVVETPIAGYTTTGGSVVNGVADITNTWVKVPVIPTPTGSLQVIKVDAATKHRLAGATFDLRDAAGNLVASGVTAENGQVMFNNLTYGTYQVVETTAPAGYDLNTKPQLVTIGETAMQSITIADTATVVPPVKPVVPVTPVTPTKPEQPRQPTTPTIPTKPVVPVKPAQPGYPDVVTVTVTPDQPAGVTFGEYYGGITPKQPQLTTVTKSSTDRPTVVTTTVTASAATVMPTKTVTPKVAHQQLPQTNDATALWLQLLGLIALLLSGLSYVRFKRLD